MDEQRAETIRFQALATALGVKYEFDAAFCDLSIEAFGEEIAAGAEELLAKAATADISRQRRSRFNRVIEHRDRLAERAGPPGRPKGLPEPTLADLLLRASESPRLPE